MTQNKIRLGIVGAGKNMVDRHIPNFQTIKDVEIIGVCNRSVESSKKVAFEYNIPKVYENWSELVNDPEIDAVVIGTWPYMHCPVTLAAITAGKHVLCEARMSMNAKEALEMYQASKKNLKLICQLVPSPITLREDRYVRRLISEGYLGEILAIEIKDGGKFLEYDTPFHWRQDSALSGHNIMSLGIWYESMMHWVGEANRVMAIGKTFVKTRKEAGSGELRAISIPDHIDVLADMDCGAQMNIQISSVTGLADEFKAVLYGSKGTLCFSSGKLYGAKKGEAELKELTIPSDEEGRWKVEEDFIHAIKDEKIIGGGANTTFEDGLKYMMFTEGVYKSIKTGRAVFISDTEITY